jgi:3-hydroxybutyryl-CoA dehydrogenase
MQPQDVRTVGVVGCGTMGSGIVEICARVGLAVIFVEGSDELVEAGRGRIEASTARAVDRGKLPAADRDAVLERIAGATDLAALADADVVIEAATEHRDAKLEIFRRVDELTRPDVVFGSNTSSIPIAELASVTKRPELVIGMHFFNPPPVMALLELTPSLVTSEATVAFARAFGERLGKSVVVAKDHAGFIVNRLLIPYLLSAIRMLDDGFATAEDIDAAVTLGLAHPMGPLRLTDLVGLDTTLQVAEVLYEEFKEPLYAPPPRLRRMVEAGHLGRKSGKGFYDYP